MIFNPLQVILPVLWSKKRREEEEGRNRKKRLDALETNVEQLQAIVNKVPSRLIKERIRKDMQELRDIVRSNYNLTEEERNKLLKEIDEIDRIP